MPPTRSLVLAAALVACKSKGAGTERLRVAAASDLTLAFTEAGTAFEQQGGPKVDFTFGSTGLLARQLNEGAPFDVFAAANVSFVDDVVRGGACEGDTKSIYARGQIVIWSADANALPKSIAELADPKYAKIALANPEHAPYGRAARDALEHAGVWSKVQDRIAYGENVQQALAFAKSGNADVAIVAQSLVGSTPTPYRAVDASLYAPLEQAVVACKHGNARTQDARAFIEFVRSQAGREILRRHGFTVPEESRDR